MKILLSIKVQIVDERTLGLLFVLCSHRKRRKRGHWFDPDPIAGSLNDTSMTAEVKSLLIEACVLSQGPTSVLSLDTFSPTLFNYVSDSGSSVASQIDG